MTLRTESFLLSGTTNCLPRSSNVCKCYPTKFFENNKEILSTDIYCNKTKSGGFPDFSLISYPIINSTSFTITLTENNLTNVPGGSFIGFTPVNLNATYLYFDLSKNSISKIENNAFIGLENMYIEMDLTQNKLTEIPFALMVLNQLRGIDLYLNPIKVIDPVVLLHMAPTVRYIDMEIRNMSWPSELSSFTNLVGIGLFDLQQSNLPRQPFNASENKLDNILVYWSNLTMLPCSLTDHSVLEELTVQHSPNISATNTVEECRPNFTMSSTFKKLHLIDGELTEFPNILKFTPKLMLLNLRGNKIQYVNEDFIPLNSELAWLMLSYNRLKTIPSSFLRFQHLTSLVLDSNYISTVQPALESLLLQNSVPYDSNLCLRNNPVNTTNLSVKCSDSGDSWSGNYLSSLNFDYA